MSGSELERTLTQPDKPRLVLAGFAFESSCPVCSRAAATFRRILGDVDFGGGSTPGVDLEHEWPVAPFSAISELGAVLQGLKDALGNHALYQKLEAIGQPEKMRRQGLEHPQLTVLLRSTYLLDPERRQALVQTLANQARSVAAFTIVFFGDRGEQALLDLDQTTARQWLAAFEPLAPCRVAVYVAVPALDRGRPIESALLADLTGICLAKDVIVDARRPFRSLSQCPDDPARTNVRTLGAFGIKAIWFSPSALADAWRDRFVRDLLLATSLPKLSRPMVLTLGSVPSPGDILRHAVEANPASRISAKAISADAMLVAPIESTPHLVGRDEMSNRSIALTLEFKQHDFARDLRSSPSDEWLEHIYTHEFLHRKEVVAEWTSQLCAAIDAQSPAVRSQLSDLLADHIMRAPDLLAAAASVRDVAQRMSQSYSLRLAKSGTPDLDECLKHVGRAMGELPNRLGLAVRTTILLLLQIMVGRVVVSSDAPWKVALLCALGLAMVVTIGLPVLRWVRAAQNLDETARRAIDTIEARCRLSACERVRETLAAFGTNIASHLEDMARQLESFHQALRPLADGALASVELSAAMVTSDSFIMQVLPDSQRAADVYRELTERELRTPSGETIDAWTRHLRAAVLRGSASGAEASSLPNDIRQLGWTRLRHSLRGLTLRRFLGDETNDARSHPAIKWLLEAQQGQRFFFDGRIAASSANAQGAIQVEYLLASGGLPEIASGSESLPTRITAIHNVVARLARVEIVRIEPHGEEP